MTRIVLNLPPETERKLREKAAQTGQTLEAYLEQVAEHDVQGKGGGAPAVSSRHPPLSDEEFDRLLDALSEGPPLPHLPADFSRADLYADHD